MIDRGRLRRIALGLGVLAGAVVPLHLSAQVPVKRDTLPARRDTLPTRSDTARARQARPPEGRDTIRVPTPPRADSMVKNDSTRLGIVPLPEPARADTLKPPLTRAEAPLILEIGPARIYDRAALFATGAVTLSDLLGRVPGLTEITTGWLAAPALVASQGELRRIRIFLDGLELDPLDRRAQGTGPVSDLPLHALEELRIERGADEVRVYARSWRVDRTTAYTRADIATGDQNTNLYRAFFGRRYAHGEALQLAAEQYNTQPDRRLPSSGALHAMARLGLTRGPWSADVFAERSDRDRGTWVGSGNSAETLDTIPGVETRRTTAYVRLGNGDPEVGHWLQLVGSVESYRLTSRSTNASPSEPAPQDSNAYENQYLLAAGANLLGLRVSATERMRVAGGEISHALSGRASATVAGLGISLLGESRSPLGPQRLEATARIVLADRLAVLGSAAQTGGGSFVRVIGAEDRDSPLTPATSLSTASPGNNATLLAMQPARYELEQRRSARAEVGIRLFDVWLSGGGIRRGGTTLLPPAEFGAAYAGSNAIKSENTATAGTLAIRGRLYRALYVDAWAVRWNDSTGLYRPQYQTRSELYIQTNLLNRFPRGNFGLLTSLAHEYRSTTRFATEDGSVRSALGFRRLDFKLEIRIQTAVISYQFRNLLQERYAEVPGFSMPRQTQFYGIRWDFWN